MLFVLLISLESVFKILSFSDMNKNKRVLYILLHISEVPKLEAKVSHR